MICLADDMLAIEGRMNEKRKKIPNVISCPHLHA